MKSKLGLAILIVLAMLIVAPTTAQTFDNSGGGSWKEYMSFPLTSPITEYAQYKIVINGTTWELYNVTGSLETSGTNDNFWSLVNSSGADIRVFNQNNIQLYFWIEKWDYANQTAVIWVNLTAGSTELNIAYGNPSATRSDYNSLANTLVAYPSNGVGIKKRILVASDIHYGQSGTDYETYWNDLKNWILDEANIKLDVVFLDGDIIHGEDVADDVGTLQNLWNDINALGIPIYFVKGNHDHITDSDFQNITGYPTNHVVVDGEFAYVIVNTSDASGNCLCADADWLDSVLSNLTDKKVLIFIHIPQHPWAEGDLDCPDVQSVIAKYDNILGVFVGHNHDLYRAYYADNTYWCWDSHVGGSWGTSFRGYGIIEIYNDGTAKYYVVDGSTKEVQYEVWLNPELKITDQASDIYIDTKNGQIYYYKPTGYIATTAVFPDLVTDKAIIEFETIDGNDNVGVIFHGADNEVRGYIFWIDYYSNEWALGIYNGASSGSRLTDTSADVSTPQKVKVIVDGNVVSIYVNGQVFVENYALDGTYSSGHIGLYIGHTIDGSQERYGIYNGYIKIYKLADPADFGTPLVKLFQKKFGTKTVYVNVTYLDTAVTERYNPTAYYKLEDKPQINVTSMLSVSGVNATYGANISIELIDFVTLDKVVYNGTEVSVTYQGTVTNSTTGYVYNVYNFTTYENGTLEIYGHVGNKAYEATFKLDGKTVDVFNVTAVVGEPLEILLPHAGNVTIASTEYTGVTSVSVNTKDLGVGAKTLVIKIEDPENFAVGYRYGTVNIDWGKVYFNITDLQNKTLARTTYGFFNKNFSILSTDPSKLYAGDIEIDVYFHGVKLKSLEIYLNHTNNGLTLNVSVNATQFKDYRNVTRIIASPNYFEVVNLSTKYPFSVMKLVNVSGTVVIDYVSNAPTSVKVEGATSYTYEKPVLKITASGNVTVTDLYKLSTPLRDRLGNKVNFYVLINGSRVDASNGIASKLLKPETYVIECPQEVAGFQFYHITSIDSLTPIPSGKDVAGVYWRYTTSSPPSGWNTDPNFNDSTWNIGETPIGDTGAYRTYVDLNGGNLYARYKFNLLEEIQKHYPALNLSEWNITIKKATVYGAVDDELWVWINGVQVLYAKLSGTYWDGSADVTPYLNLTDNLVAIRVYDSGKGSNYFDLMLTVTVELEKKDRVFTVNITLDSRTPKAEYRVPSKIETKEVRIQKTKFPWLPFPFPFSENKPAQEETPIVRLEGTLRDFYNAPVANRMIKIEVASPNYTRIYNVTTDESGNFKIDVDMARGVEYKVTYKFAGDDVYVGTSTTKTFTIEQLLPAPPEEMTITELLIFVGIAVGLIAVVAGAIYLAKRTKAKTLARMESEFRFFRRLK